MRFSGCKDYAFHAIYHVMLRGINRQDIFDDTYRFMLCAVLERACHIEPDIKRYGIDELTTRHKQLKKRSIYTTISLLTQERSKNNNL